MKERQIELRVVAPGSFPVDLFEKLQACEFARHPFVENGLHAPRKHLEADRNVPPDEPEDGRDVSCQRWISAIVWVSPSSTTWRVAISCIRSNSSIWRPFDGSIHVATWMLEYQRHPGLRSSGQPEGPAGPTRTSPRRIAVLDRWRRARHRHPRRPFGFASLQPCPPRKCRWKSAAIRSMNPMAGLMAGTDSAPALVQCRPPHLNFDFNPGFYRGAQRLKGRIVVGKRRCLGGCLVRHGDWNACERTDADIEFVSVVQADDSKERFLDGILKFQLGKHPVLHSRGAIDARPMRRTPGRCCTCAPGRCRRPGRPVSPVVRLCRCAHGLPHRSAPRSSAFRRGEPVQYSNRRVGKPLPQIVIGHLSCLFPRLVEP